MIKAYRITRNGEEVWKGYQIANLDSALATAYTWQQENYNHKTRKYPIYEIYECDYQFVPWGTPVASVKELKECNPVFVGLFSEDSSLRILKRFAKSIFTKVYKTQII